MFDDGSAALFGDAKCQGGQLRFGGRRVAAAACGGAHTCLLLDDGSVRLLGLNACGVCDVPDLNGCKVTQVTSGTNHVGLLLEDDSVVLFGHDA